MNHKIILSFVLFAILLVNNNTSNASILVGTLVTPKSEQMSQVNDLITSYNANFNADLHHINNRIKIIKTNVDNFNTGKYDLIISNPPYIDKHQLKYLGVSEFEPLNALNGGFEGIEVLIKVVLKASQLLKECSHSE